MKAYRDRARPESPSTEDARQTNRALVSVLGAAFALTSGIRASWTATARAGSAAGLATPAIATTFWANSPWTAATADSAVSPSSTTMRLTLCGPSSPRRPATKTEKPFAMSSPIFAKGPAFGTTNPMLTVSPDGCCVSSVSGSDVQAASPPVAPTAATAPKIRRNWRRSSDGSETGTDPRLRRDTGMTPPRGGRSETARRVVSRMRRSVNVTDAPRAAPAGRMLRGHRPRTGSPDQSNQNGRHLTFPPDGPHPRQYGRNQRIGATEPPAPDGRVRRDTAPAAPPAARGRPGRPAAYRAGYVSGPPPSSAATAPPSRSNRYA